MMPNDRLEGQLTGWFGAQGSEQQPAGFHDDAIVLVGRSRQRPRWLATIALGRPFAWTGPTRRREALLVLALTATTLLLVLAAIVGDAPRVAPLPRALARNGSIAYGVGDNVGIIHLIDPDGTNDRIIGDGRCPTFSADGSVLARWTGPSPRPGRWGQTLTLSGPDGGDPRTITGVDQSPYFSTEQVVLSPDGTLMTWVHPGDGDSGRELWVGPVAGGPGILLVPATFAPGSLRLPSWSPDGRSIAFETAAPGWSGRSIYVVDAQGGEPRLLSSRPGPQQDVAWSPDSRSIAYAGVPDGVAIPSSRDVNSEVTMDVFVIGADGTGERDVADGPDDESRPRWSPDGTRLAFLREYGTTLGVVDVGPGSSSPVAPVAGGDGVDGFAWSPDGTRLLGYSSTTTIRTIPLDGTAPWSMTPAEQPRCEPSWQALPAA